MSFWDTIGNVGGDLFAQTGLGQDTNGAYNLYNKAAGNPASQLIGSSGNPFATPVDPSKSLDPGDYDPTVKQSPLQMTTPEEVHQKYIQNQLQSQTQKQQSATADGGTNIPQFNTGPQMQWMGPAQSKEGLLGGLLKTAAIGAIA